MPYERALLADEIEEDREDRFRLRRQEPGPSSSAMSACRAARNFTPGFSATTRSMAIRGAGVSLSSTIRIINALTAPAEKPTATLLEVAP